MESCVICGEAVRLLGNGMTCNECGSAFHLRLQDGDTGPECGSYVHLSELGTGCCGMLYACARCLDEARAARKGAPDSVAAR
jgi:hypothetical protein